MGLTWRDAVPSCAIVVIVLTYAVYLGGTSLLLIASAWATSAVILVLGIGCAVVASGDLYTRPQPRMGQAFRWIASGFGAIAVIAGLIGLITGSACALEILVVATILWLATGSSGTCSRSDRSGAMNRPGHSLSGCCRIQRIGRGLGSDALPHATVRYSGPPCLPARVHDQPLWPSSR